MDVTVNGDRPGWLLHQAAIYNNIELMKSLLEGPERNSVNAQDSYGRTPLYTSVTFNSLECCHLLLDSGADVNLPCGAQLGLMTPLHLAASNNNLPLVKLLLDRGADFQKKDASEKRAIELAEINRSTESIEAIREKMERDKRQKDRLQKEFIEACLRCDVDDAKRISTDPGFTLQEVVQIVNGFRLDQLDLLYRACDRGSEAMCEFLLQIGASVVPNDKTGQNSFHVSCLFGHVNCARLLLQQYPDVVNIATFEGSLPIHLACLLGQLDIIKLLLAHSACLLLEQTSNISHVTDSINCMINSRDAFGQTPLHVAVTNKHIMLIQYLLNGRLVISSQELRHDVESEFEDDSSQASCNESSRTDDEKSNNSAAELELEFMAEVDADNLEGMTPFHLAVMGDGKVSYYDIVDLLLRHKADPNRPIRTLSGLTPALMEAVQRSDPVLLDLLLSHGAKDEQLRVLKTAIMLHDDDSVGRIIQHRTYVESEFKVGHKRLIELLKQKNLGMECLANIPEPFAVMVCWHGLALQKIALSWLQLACEHHLRRVRSFMDQINEVQSFCLLFVSRVDISNNRLSILPSFLFSLPNLRILNASFNQIRAITKVYDSGTLEREISTSLPVDFQLEDFDDDIDIDCPLLEDINLQKNQLFVLPTAIFKLPSLKRLNTSDNQICSLPFDMWMSTSLVELNLSNNRLDSLPCFPDNAFSESRIENGCSPALTTACSLESGNSPTSVCRWETDASVMAEFLNASGGSGEPTDPKQEYTTIPTTYINCWQDRIQVELAPVSTQVDEKKSEQHSQMKELNLSGNQLEEVPHGLPCLVPRLEKLSLARNRLTQMGHPEMYPSSLKSLDLSQNKICNEENFGKTSAISISNSTSPGTRSSAICYSPFHSKSFLPLTTLSASNPMLRRLSSSALSSSSHSLTSLVSQLSPWICPHRVHRHFVRLKALKLDYNLLTRFFVRAETTTGTEGRSRFGSPVDGNHSPASTSHDYPLFRTATFHTDKKKLKAEKADKRETELLYPNLILLDLSNNEIESLPADISELTQLAEVKVSNNKIKELPPEMGLMKKLWYLDFAGCPVETTLRSLLGEKATRTMTILSYLKSIREEAKPFNRMKLMFVGKHGIGKTTLLSQLRSYSGDRNKFTHWAQRMGHEMKDKDLKGENISTVGVDIGTFEMQRGNDKIVFSTWDFGGQREYYATHQYFLSKRSLYLVIWKVTDGEEGVNEILRWLINIQARAPNSPVIIVGTHRDALRKKFPRVYLENLGELVERKYIQVTDPDKLGLPRVMGHVEVSCKGGLMSRTYVSQLVDMIWKVANEEHQPGNPGSRLLDQLVPASYLHLQDVVVKVAEERKQERKDPVLYGGQYKHLVIGKMEEMFGVSFQDISELNQATQFLHENGILLHYDDISLRDLYFLDPQWLCDMLANVITIREINGLVRSGLMMADDLKLLFKGVSFRSQDIKSYIVDLLQKFEVALLWNESSLIIPSLLPTDRDLASGVRGRQRGVRIPVQGFGSTALQDSTSADLVNVEANLATDDRCSSVPIPPVSTNSSAEGMKDHGGFIVTNIFNPAISVIRLYVMSYFPSGFWPRLITRLLGDLHFSDMLMSLYDFSRLPCNVEKLTSLMGMAPCWNCWQTGALLRLLDVTVLQIKEVTDYSPGLFDYAHHNLVMKSEEDINWSAINTSGMSFLEILIPNETLEIEVPARHLGQFKGQRFIVYPNSHVVASLLAKIVDCVDLLLEDWYPDIGIRFTQNTRGMYLITRLVPCTRCFLLHGDALNKDLRSDARSVVSAQETRRASVTTSENSHETRVERVLPFAVERLGRTRSNSQLHGIQGCSHLHDGVRSYSCDREMKRNSKERPRSGEVRNGAQFCFDSEEWGFLTWTVYCYTVEQCLQVAQLNRIVFCPKHGNLGPFFVASDTGLVFSGHVAPDTVFLDIGDELLVDRDSVVLQKFLGKGAFGAVFSGTIVRKHTSEVVPVALKMLQPIKPLSGATYSQQQLYQIEKARWDKDPLKNCCEAYLNARKELGILLTLRHEHMVPLVGVSVSPLCLVLSLAPLGALSDFLRDYLSAGARLPVHVIHQIILQVSSALEYLHSHQVIYRDLKSDNILVWSLPPPHSFDRSHPVDIKLADYGVSRLVQPFGMKGFAGTLAFMAPEIIRHGGEETYTEKVDCFSFGMFLYELLLLQAPYDDTGNPAGSNINIKSHVLAGGRPTITNKEVSLPSNILDLMTLCWSPEPTDRPSAAEIVAFARSIEFSTLHNAVMLDEEQQDVVCCCSAPRNSTLPAVKTEESLTVDFGLIVPERVPCDVWMSCQGPSSGSLLVYTYEEQDCIESKRINFDFSDTVTCMCVTKTDVWCACTKAKVHIFSRSDYSHVTSFSRSSDGSSDVIKFMSYGELEDKVYVCLDAGQFVVYSDIKNISSMPTVNDYPGNREPIWSMTALRNVRSEVWCGQSCGRIQVWRFRVGAVCVQTLVHEGENDSRSCTSLLVPSSSDSDVMWSFVSPGTIVYRWSIKNRCLTGQVNVAQVPVPYSVPDVMHRVQSLNAIGSYLYIGATSGFVLIFNAKSCDLVNICHAHECPVSAVLPISFPSSSEAKQPTTHNGWLESANPSSASCLFVTVAKGYRDLVRTVIERYQRERNNLCKRVFLLTWSGENWLETSSCAERNHLQR